MSAVPFKYLKTDWGIIALVSAFDEEGNARNINVEGGVRAEVIDEGLMGVVVGDLTLPIPPSLLDFVIQNPLVQVSMITDKIIDEEHILVKLETPALYELRGLWRAKQKQL